ncbi:hypothetical protein Droror1_Dr00008629 [Drosera rotundifolia]
MLGFSRISFEKLAWLCAFIKVSVELRGEALVVHSRNGNGSDSGQIGLNPGPEIRTQTRPELGPTSGRVGVGSRSGSGRFEVGSRRVHRVLE